MNNERMDIEEINEALFALSRNEQITYSSKVIPNCKPIIGVRIPELRKLAKRLAKEDYKFFLDNCPDEYFEQITLQAFVIGYAKDDINTIFGYADQFIPKITDWSVNDSFCQSFIIAKKNREKVWKWLENYAIQNDEFSQRVVAVMAMSHFLVDEYIDQVLQLMNRLKNSGYYVKMGVAWCLATAYAKYPNQSIVFLKDNQLTNWTYNKAIQKMLESFRVSDKDKEMLKKMKR